MARYLSIVEDAYRGTVEEQDDTAVWFTHALRNAGAEAGILLRGSAVYYAVKGQDTRGLRFGTRALTGAPRLDQDLVACIRKSVLVYLVAEDAADRGIPEGELLPGVIRVPRRQIGKLVDQFDRAIHW